MRDEKSEKKKSLRNGHIRHKKWKTKYSRDFPSTLSLWNIPLNTRLSADNTEVQLSTRDATKDGKLFDLKWNFAILNLWKWEHRVKNLQINTEVNEEEWECLKCDLIGRLYNGKWTFKRLPTSGVRLDTMRKANGSLMRLIFTPISSPLKFELLMNGLCQLKYNRQAHNEEKTISFQCPNFLLYFYYKLLFFINA